MSAYAVCTDDADRLLLCRIAPGASVSSDGWWTLPGGGLEHGEDPRAGAMRELAEEAGLSGEIVDLLEVDSLHTEFVAQDGSTLDWHGIRILYRCRILGGELRAEVGGSTDMCRWFSPAELRDERLVDLAQLAARRVDAD